MDDTFKNFVIESQGMDGDYRWITFKTPNGKEVKMQEGWGETVFNTDREKINMTEEAAKLVVLVSKGGEVLIDNKKLSNSAIYDIIKKYPSYELAPFITAYVWFNKEVSMPDQYSFRPEDIKSVSTK